MRKRMKRCLALLGAALCLSAGAWATEYSEPVTLLPYVEAQENMETDAVWAQLAYPVQWHGVDGSVLFWDEPLETPFPLRVDEDGRAFIDGDAMPRVEALDADCIAPPYQTQAACAGGDPSAWQWQEALFAPEGTQTIRAGDIDAATGELVGYVPADGGAVYLVYREAVTRYEVRYVDGQGRPLPLGETYALSGSDLRHPPVGLLGDLPVLTVQGTGASAPSHAEGPAVLCATAAEPPAGLPMQLADMQEDLIVTLQHVDADAPYDMLYMERGQTFWVSQASVPPLKQRVVKWTWVDESGNKGEITDIPAGQLTVMENIFVLVHTQPAPATVRFGTPAARQTTEDSDSILHWFEETQPLLYDAGRDAYYVRMEDVPAVLHDDIGNAHSLGRTAGDWVWGLTEEKLEDGLSLDGDSGRLYFPDGFPWRKAWGGEVLLVHTDAPRLHRLSLHDIRAEEAYLHFWVLDGGALAGLADVPDLLSGLRHPEAFRHWRMVGSVDTPPPEKMTGPLALEARIDWGVDFLLGEAPRYEVLPGGMRVLDGDVVNWSVVPEPPFEQTGGIFVRWRPLQEALEGKDLAAVPITEPTQFVAVIDPKVAVTFWDAEGEMIETRLFSPGEPVDVSGVRTPIKGKLSFSHWAYREGGDFLAGTRAGENIDLFPVFRATVTFMNGDTVHDVRTVREGGILYDLPENPLRADHVFTGWSVDFGGLPITESLTVEAVYVRATASPAPRATKTPAATARAAATVRATGVPTARVLAAPGRQAASAATQAPQGMPPYMQALLPGMPWPPDMDAATGQGRFAMDAQDVPYNGTGPHNVSDCIE